MNTPNQWQKFLFAGLFCSGLVLVIAGVYLSQVETERPNTLTSPVQVSAEIPLGTPTQATVDWCDAMMEKPNTDWQGDEFKRFSANCLNPENEPVSE